MLKWMSRSLFWISVNLFVLMSCIGPLSEDSLEKSINVNLLYPTAATQMEMGQTVKSIIKVKDAAGQSVKNAEIIVRFSDPDGTLMETMPAEYGSGDVYRTEGWQIPNRQKAGAWKIEVLVTSGTGRYSFYQFLIVNNSTSEILLDKYGFWIAAPNLRGIVPSIVGERGDARNGLIRWGGTIPSQHVLPENWIEIQWREGAFDIQNAEDARRFMLEELGDIGFTPIREIGLFSPFQFKGWDGWRAKVRGQVRSYDIEWVIFYASEVHKTYAIGTTVVQPPAGIDAHAFLRESFEVYPEQEAHGSAPEPLLQLLPGPGLLSPALGRRFVGINKPIVLQWIPVKPLTADEYYQVAIDFNYAESNTLKTFTTHSTEFTLPEGLYQIPNCGVFNWEVTLMQQARKDNQGQPVGKPVSYKSLYWYVEWRYPVDQLPPFNRLCPNAQY